MIRFRRLLLLLWVLGTLPLTAQTVASPIYYYWIDENHLCLWKTSDDPNGVIAKRTVGTWEPINDADLARQLRDAGSAQDVSKVLDKLSTERPPDGWAKPRQPDTELILSINAADAPTSGMITVLSGITHNAKSAGVTLNGQQWQKNQKEDLPLANLFVLENDHAAAKVLAGEEDAKAQWLVFWNKYIQNALKERGPRLSQYTDRDRRPRALLQYTVVEPDRIATRAALVCPAIVSPKPCPPAPTSSWFGWPTLIGLVLFVSGVVSAKRVRKMASAIRNWTPLRGRRGGAEPNPQSLPDKYSPIYPEKVAETPASSKEIELAIETAWQEVHIGFVNAIKRAMGEQRSLVVGASDSGVRSTLPSTPSSWELAACRSHKEASNISKNSKLRLLNPGNSSPDQWLNELPSTVHALVESVDRFQKEYDAAARELERHQVRSATLEGQLTELRSVRDSLQQKVKVLEGELAVSRADLETSSNNLANANKQTEQLRQQQTATGKDLENKQNEIQGLAAQIETLQLELASARNQAAANQAAGDRLQRLDQWFHALDNLAKRLQEGHQQHYSAKGDVTATAMISFLADHSLYKLAVGTVKGDEPLANLMLVNLNRISTQLQGYRGFALAAKALQSDFPTPPSPLASAVLSAGERPEGSIFQFTLGFLRNSHQIDLAPFYLDVNDQGMPYRAD